jgi:glycosyltransferase involved in cell wall biosynthesis
MNNSFFSIVIPSYNRAKVILPAINSVLTQTFQDFELIIADDGSTDETRSVVESLNDPRIKYYYQSNAGPSAARNFGSQKAIGKYLVFLDSDDSAERNWLQEFYNVINTKQEADLICCGIKKETKDHAWKVVLPSEGRYLFKKEKTLFLAGAFCVKREIFLSVGGYDVKLKFSENTDLRFKILSQTKQAFSIDKPLVLYNYTTKGAENKLNKAYGNLRFINNNKMLLKGSRMLLSNLLYLQGSLFLDLGRKHYARKFFKLSFNVNPVKIKSLIKLVSLYR